ncbi:choline dehydrogenase-like flavoprotein [Novosphingobium sp. AP12]|nr:choline dehydrogenase-like flavoprotein [Novosphingobium sp. AP12]
MTKWHASPDGGQVEAVTISTFDGRQRVVRALTFVLCGGGLEGTRLFLSSADDVPGGLGSGYGMAGRFFMQHPRGRIGRLEADARTPLALQDRHAIFGVRDGLQYETGFALTERAQREGGLLNASVILTYDADPDSGWAAFKSLPSTEPEGPERTYGRAGALMRKAKDPGSIASNLWRKGRQKRHAACPVSGINLLIDLEQTPDPDSRITLSSDRDRLGMRKARVDWRIGNDERRTAAQFGHFLPDHFTRTGGGKVELDEWVHDSGPVGDELTGTHHHIATLRMSQSPRDGVVDGHCRVHGVDNLCVSSCAIFATGGHANPTLTIVALASRLADHIRHRLNRPQLCATRTAPEVAVVS